MAVEKEASEIEQTTEMFCRIIQTFLDGETMYQLPNGDQINLKLFATMSVRNYRNTTPPFIQPGEADYKPVNVVERKKKR